MEPENVFHLPLPDNITNITQSSLNNDFQSKEFIKSILETNLPNLDQKNLDHELHKTFLLLKHKSAKKPQAKVRKNKQYLTRSEKNKLQIGKIGRNSLKYLDLIPLHNLWKDYFKNFIELDKYETVPTPEDRSWEGFSTLLWKADYHGAKFTVVRSTCPSLVNHTGICVMETKNILHLVDEKNTTRQIPKPTTVFQLIIDNLKITIFGKHMAYRPAERSTKNIKRNNNVADL